MGMLGYSMISLIYLTTLIYTIDGQFYMGWSRWTSWSRCSVPCENGETTRTRFCINHQICGQDFEVDRQPCNQHRCPINGGWDQWETWDSCSATCGGGYTSRRRQCDNPQPEHGGRFCQGGNIRNINHEGIEFQWRRCNADVVCPEHYFMGRGMNNFGGRTFVPYHMRGAGVGVGVPQMGGPPSHMAGGLIPRGPVVNSMGPVNTGRSAIMLNIPGQAPSPLITPAPAPVPAAPAAPVAPMAPAAPAVPAAPVAPVAPAPVPAAPIV